MWGTLCWEQKRIESTYILTVWKFDVWFNFQTLRRAVSYEGFKHKSSRPTPHQSHRFFKRQTRCECKSFFMSAVSLPSQTCHTNCTCKAVWWNFFMISLSLRCILSWNQNNFGGSFRPQLHLVNLGKLSRTESNESSCVMDFESSEAVLIRQQQRGDITVPVHAQNMHMINHLTDIWLLCLCVWFALTDQGCLCQWCGFSISLAGCAK